jgi:hypothetical protein
MSSNLRFHMEALLLHPGTQRAQLRDRIHLRLMTLITLQTARLRDQSLSPADLHTVDYMDDLHAWQPDANLALTGSFSG